MRKSPGVVLFAYCLAVVALMWVGLTREANTIQKEEDLETLSYIITTFVFDPEQ